MTQDNATPIPDHLLSIVIPLHNEEGNVRGLMEDLAEVLADYRSGWELILVDDGSTDQTLARLEEETRWGGGNIAVVELQRNFGQTAAMQAGIDRAAGDIIVTLDGDRQNDPKDILRLARRLVDDDLDLVSGYRKNRRDSMVVRKLPSWLANKLIARITGVRLRDFGCSLKAYRANILKEIRLYGEMHRFIPALLASRTHQNRIAEEVVAHHPRLAGTSKYGIMRTYRVILDLIFVYFFMRFRDRPAHFFGAIGLPVGLLGGAILVYLTGLKLATGENIGQRPLLLFGVLLVMIAFQILTTGLLSEMLVRTYFESSNSKPYRVRPPRDGGASSDKAGPAS